MASPVVIQETVGGSGTSFTTSANTAVGDYVVVFMGTTGTVPSQPGGTFTTGWTVGPDKSTLTNGRAKSWYRRLTTGGSAITVTTSGGTSWIWVLVVRNAHDTTFLEDSDGLAGTGNANRIIPSMDSPRDDEFYLGFWLNNHQSGLSDSISPPAGMVEVAEGTTTGTSSYVASQSVNTGATGTRVPTFTRAASGTFPSACLGMLIRPAFVPISATDSATGSETIAVVAGLALTDSATGAETASIAADTAVTDSAVGHETASIAADTAVTDSAVGHESIVIEIPTEKSPTDSAVGHEVASIAATFDGLTDSAVGHETIEILRISSLTDSAVGHESFGPVGHDLTDSGVGHESIEIVDLPATNVLPRPARRLKYDLVVWAMVPQSGGPPAFVEVDPIPWDELSYTDTLGEPQDLSVTCQASSLPESIVQRLENSTELPMELRLKRNGVTVFAGPPLGLQEQGESLTISARGLLVYVDMMYVLNDLKYESAPKDQFLLAKEMVDAWQAIDYGHYGIDTSTVTASGVLRAVTYLRDEEHNVGQKIRDLGKMAGGFDAEIDPGSRQLQLWSPYKGVDRSSGEDSVIIDKQTITSSDITVSLAPSDVASLGIGTSKPATADATLYSVQYNTDLAAKLGLRGYASTYDASTQAELDQYNAAALAARSRPLVIPGPKVRVTVDVDLPSYAYGDTIQCKLGGILRASGAHRIRRRKVIAEKSGRETVDLEFV